MHRCELTGEKASCRLSFSYLTLKSQAWMLLITRVKSTKGGGQLYNVQLLQPFHCSTLDASSACHHFPSSFKAKSIIQWCWGITYGSWSKEESLHLVIAQMHVLRLSKWEQCWFLNWIAWSSLLSRGSDREHCCNVLHQFPEPLFVPAVLWLISSFLQWFLITEKKTGVCFTHSHICYACALLEVRTGFSSFFL